MHAQARTDTRQRLRLQCAHCQHHAIALKGIAIGQKHAETLAHALDGHCFLRQPHDRGLRAAHRRIQFAPQVVAVCQPRQEFQPAALAQMQGVGEGAGHLCIDAQILGPHVEQMLRPRRPIGDTATEGLGHADQRDAYLRIGRLRQCTDQRGAAEAGADDGDMGFHVHIPLNDSHVVPAACRRCVNVWLAPSNQKRMS